MRFWLAVTLAVPALTAVACVRQPNADQRAARTEQHVTMVGCVEHGDTADEFVVRGRTLNRQIVPPAGPNVGGVHMKETGTGGDPFRNPLPNAAVNEGEQITSRLVGTSGATTDLRSILGHRVVVIGEYLPGSDKEPTAHIRADSISQVAPNCLVQ